MKTLDQVLTEKMTRLRLEQMGRSKLATLMIYLQDFIGLPLHDQEKNVGLDYRLSGGTLE
jgi:hypothetical protein